MTMPLGKGARKELLKVLKLSHDSGLFGDASIFEDCVKVMEDDAAEIDRLRELLRDARHCLPAPDRFLSGIYSAPLLARIDAALAGAADQQSAAQEGER